MTPSATATTAATPATPSRLESIPLAKLRTSRWNNRSEFDDAENADLKSSIAQVGILTPLIVRPIAGGLYEIAAGERRHRAAKAVGLAKVPCMVRAMDDATFLTVVVVENNQRQNVHPLDEGAGYAALIKQAGLHVHEIAARVGRSDDYVLDRLRLEQLIEDARTLFRRGRMRLEHAKLLARETPEAQRRILSPRNHSQIGGESGGFWLSSSADKDPALALQGLSRYDGLKPKTPAELAEWINRHVRLPVDQPDLIGQHQPDTADTLIAAAEADVKVVHITHDFIVHSDARDERVKTLGANAWKRADGQRGSKVCDHAVVGVVVAGSSGSGEGVRGEAFPICPRNEKCAVHWPERVKRAASRAKAKKAGDRTTEKQASVAQSARDKRADVAAAEKAKLEEERAEREWPVLRGQLAAAVRVMTPAHLVAALQNRADDQYYGEPDDLTLVPFPEPGPASTSLEVVNAVRAFVWADLMEDPPTLEQLRARHSWDATRVAKIGIDVKALVKDVDRALAAGAGKGAGKEVRGEDAAEEEGRWEDAAEEVGR